MVSDKQKRATKRIQEILRVRRSSLANEIAKVEDVRQLTLGLRERIVDELGDEFAAKGLLPDGEPNAYGLEIEDLTDACGLAAHP